MKLSIIIATYNSESTLGCALDSIFAQTFKDFEVIIVDGASKDNTRQVVEKYSGAKIVFVSEPDDGIYDAWNKGVRISNGDLTLFLGSDDKFSSVDSLAKLIKSSEKNPSSLFWYGNTAKLGMNDGVVGVVGEPWIAIDSFKFNYIVASLSNPIMSAIYRTECIKKLQFDQSLKIAADYDMVIRMLSLSGYTPPLKIDSQLPLVDMGYGGVSTNVGTGLNCLLETMAVRRRYGISVINATLFFRAVKIYLMLFVSAVFGDEIRNNLLGFWHKIKRRDL